MHTNKEHSASGTRVVHYYYWPALSSPQLVLLTCSVSTDEACTAGAARRLAARRPAAAQNEVFIVKVYVAGAAVTEATYTTECAGME